MNANEIPPMTNDLGVYWRQPDPKNILIDDEHAVISQQDFAHLKEYSLTNPSGVYDGKMWRRHDAEMGWLLVWYGPHPDPETASINFRKVLICG